MDKIKYISYKQAHVI